MIEFALVVAGATLVAGIIGAWALRLLKTVSSRLVGLALLGGSLPVAAVLLSGVAMFHMGADVVILAVAAASSTVAIGAALLVTRSISSPLRDLQRSARLMAAGDFTARVHTEAAPTELAELAGAFNEMAARLGRLFDARRELVAWASHDLRTPLTALHSALEAIEDGVVEPGHYLQAMRQNVRTLRRLVDDLFELTQIDAGAVTLDLKDVQVGPVVKACVDALRSEAQSRRIRLALGVPDSLPDVRMAPDKVERVLMNVLTNAFRFTPVQGSVSVSAERRNGEVVIAVDDSGRGIAAGNEQRMFDRFWRGDPARSPGRDGAGLGLAIAKGLVEAHGGRIWAENRAGGGARVAFTLPVSDRRMGATPSRG
jgi:signal transduction histidine kinase